MFYKNYCSKKRASKYFQFTPLRRCKTRPHNKFGVAGITEGGGGTELRPLAE